jgi:hypothetical protein
MSILRPACKVADGRSAGGKPGKPYSRDDKNEFENFLQNQIRLFSADIVAVIAIKIAGTVVNDFVIIFLLAGNRRDVDGCSLSLCALNNFLELATVEPDTAAFWAIVDLNFVFLDDDQSNVTAYRAIHMHKSPLKALSDSCEESVNLLPK